MYVCMYEHSYVLASLSHTRQLGCDRWLAHTHKSSFANWCRTIEDDSDAKQLVVVVLCSLRMVRCAHFTNGKQPVRTQHNT